MTSGAPLPSHKSPSFPDDHSGVRCRDIFLSHPELEAKLRDRNVILDGSVLSDLRCGVRFVLKDAVRILGPAGASVDLFGMTGRVAALTELFGLGATIGPQRLRIANVDYDIQLGFLLQPIADP